MPKHLMSFLMINSNTLYYRTQTYPAIQVNLVELIWQASIGRIII